MYNITYIHAGNLEVEGVRYLDDTNIYIYIYVYMYNITYIQAGNLELEGVRYLDDTNNYIITVRRTK